MNEAIADGAGTNILRNSLWFEIIGLDFIAKAFQYAHEADPDSILRHNDYGLENPAKLICLLQEQKVPLHSHRLAGSHQRHHELRDHGSGAHGIGLAWFAH